MTCTQLFLVTFLVLWMGVSSLTTVTKKVARVGLCPKPLAFNECTASSDKNCSDDEECIEKMKCCDTGCGHRCVYAVRPGFCPLNDLKPPKAGTKQKPKCKSDYDCHKNAKCCERESSRDCLPTLKKKPGRCPDNCEPKS
ncbi:hypothetical protein PRIEUP_LOCUS16697, partial [Pristimantis euphronides]